ncbi:ACP S-malonyltransferase [Candidatus Bipolaricaulota bacterium]|nr:ACP S-malonyltransferase [Candidatus Bipolaricaulota bacterium]
MKKLAFLFPGQGSQKVGMGEGFSNDHRVTPLYETANEVMGFDLKKLSLEGPEDQLSRTEYAQPAIFTDSIARFRILSDEGLEPRCVLGHSLGEFSALVAADSLTFTEGIKLVKKRGELTGNIDVEGSMVAVLGAEYAKVEELVEQMKEPITIANYNSPKQVVISGREDHLEESCKRLRNENAKCIELDVTGPFHSPFMEEAEKELKRYIDECDISDPDIPVLSGVSGSFETKGSRLSELLARQMTHPVMWVNYVESLEDFGIDTTVEVGPDKTLTKLTERTIPGLEGKSFNEVI